MLHKLQVLAIASIAPMVSSQTVTNGNFTFLGSYVSQNALGGRLGGGSIVGNELLLIVEAEAANSFLASVPIQRNSTTGKITGFDFANATTKYSEPEMDQISEKPNFVGDQYVFSVVEGDDNNPYTMRFADKDFTAFSSIENITSLGLTDNATGDAFQGPYGVDFSPVITDPGTGQGKMMATSTNSFWEMGLQLKSGTTNEWEFTDVTKLAALDAYYTGGFSFVPSGTNKNNIFLSDWDNNIVKMMTFDSSTGRPTGNVTTPEVTDFITGIQRPWGFFFDPQTNDFFVSTWAASEDGLVHFEGFPPGLDQSVVISNIQNEMNIALQLLLAGRRKLKAGKSPSKLRQDRRNLKEKRERKPKNPISRCPPANSNSAFGFEKAGKDCVSVEVEIPTADEIAEQVLSFETSEEAAESFASILTDAFGNDSFTENVIDGGDTSLFEENLSNVFLSVSQIEDVAFDSGLIAADLAEVQESLARVQELLDLLGSVVEGA